MGFVVAYAESGDPDFLRAAYAAWRFIERALLDGTHGEWLARVDREGRPYASDDKAGSWKGPYHNVRACLGAMHRTEAVFSAP